MTLELETQHAPYLILSQCDKAPLCMDVFQKRGWESLLFQFIVKGHCVSPETEYTSAFPFPTFILEFQRLTCW